MQSAVTEEPLPVAVIAEEEIELAAMSQPLSVTVVEPPVEIAPEALGCSASTQAGRPLSMRAIASAEMLTSLALEKNFVKRRGIVSSIVTYTKELLPFGLVPSAVSGADDGGYSTVMLSVSPLYRLATATYLAAVAVSSAVLPLLTCVPAAKAAVSA